MKGFVKDGIAFLLAITPLIADAQSALDSIHSVAGTDSLYIGRYRKKNEVRFYYGARGNSLTYESLNESLPTFRGNLYRNIGDFVGAGITYKKWLDVDGTFALPGTTYLKEERSNLKQFALSARLTFRHLSMRAYYMDATGVVAASDHEMYLSPPSAHERRIGAQAFYFFNANRYSYRAALYQSEVQLQSAGSFMVGTEFFYRDLSANQGLSVPSYDIPSRYGDQAGLKTLRAPGLLILPGYAYAKVWKQGTYFLSGLANLGGGIAFNQYRADNGANAKNNLELSGNLMLSGGYNGSQHYVRLLALALGRYELIKPTFLASTNLMIDVQVGWRF